jgi:hypothetical protein
LLAGRVLPVATAGRSFSSVLLALEYQVTLSIDLKATRRDGTPVPIDPSALAETELYVASADPEAARRNREEALRRISTLLAGRVHDALFERVLP